MGAVSLFDRLRDMLKGKADTKAIERHQIDVPVVEPFTDSTVEPGSDHIRPPDILKEDINHSGHMRIVARNNEEAEKLSVNALATALDRKTIRYGNDDVSGYMSDKNTLGILTLMKNGETIAAYPVLKAGKPWQARLTQVLECNNTYEGQLEIFVNGGALTFFDSLYFKNRSTYFPARDVQVIVSGIAYVLSRTRAATDAGTKKQGADDMLVRYENGDVDDYVFRGTVAGVKDMLVLGKKAAIIRTTIRTSHDGQPLEFYICATSSAISEKINPGDHISGIIWLQGYVVS